MKSDFTKSDHEALQQKLRRLRMLIDTYVEMEPDATRQRLIRKDVRQLLKVRTDRDGTILWPSTIADKLRVANKPDSWSAGGMNCEVESLREGISSLLHQIWRVRRKLTFRERVSALRLRKIEIERQVREAASNVLPYHAEWHVRDKGVQSHYLVGAMWPQQMEAVGGCTIAKRFLTRADLVDQIGEYDLFQIEYYEGADRTVHHGFVARYRGTKIRGFGAKPEVALGWCRRQVILTGTKKLTQ